MLRFLLAVIVLCPVSVCAQPAGAPAYFREACRLIERNYYKAPGEAFLRIRGTSIDTLLETDPPSAAYPAIHAALAALHDKHCRLLLPAAPNPVTDSVAFRWPFASFKSATGVNVLELYSFSSAAREVRRKVADSLYALVRQLAREGKLIIDLRNMEGGSNAPFLCALAPLTGESKLFTYVNRQKDKTGYVFDRGRLIRTQGRARIAELSLSDYDSQILPVKIAVITGPYTASAGEIIALIFRGLPFARSFGEPTYGVPTGVAVFPLSDAASLALAVSVPVDRDGDRHVGPIPPDVATAADKAMEMAEAWIIH
ncbi:S41 family peptidase [Chitinophaga lutea]